MKYNCHFITFYLSSNIRRFTSVLGYFPIVFNLSLILVSTFNYKTNTKTILMNNVTIYFVHTDTLKYESRRIYCEVYC